MRKDAEKALAKMNGHGYDSLILSVSWSRTSFLAKSCSPLMCRTPRTPTRLIPSYSPLLYYLHVVISHVSASDVLQITSLETSRLILTGSMSHTGSVNVSRSARRESLSSRVSYRGGCRY
jgi:hypothetical protein